jgi:hypothetical protein
MIPDNLLLRDFGPYGTIFMNMNAVITVAMVWGSFVAKGFWAVWDNITTVVIEAYYIRKLLQNVAQLQ